ncbi:ligase-associated DNA damage response endonuclease PdeM [Winogradskyella sp. HB-48]|uniref:ligase-associated DNA damage response endonuclease PdeM n=1 Tax=Winogradskyella sp. HB-48 TaxID=3416808 RepID=UPI003CED2E08
MTIVTKHITVADDGLILTNQRAIYWDTQKALILSDLHIGKTAHFRRHGIPVPDDILQKDLERLQQLIRHFKAKQLLIVGDLFHAENNVDMSTFESWLAQFTSLEVTLIKGNHDRQSHLFMEKMNIKVESELFLKPYFFVHEPGESNSDKFTISGHLHPGILIKGKGRQRLKLPCYLVASNRIILPAFSLFTGLHIIDIPEHSICFPFTESQIFEFN